MTYEEFLKLSLTYQKQSRLIWEAYKIGVDLYEFTDGYSVCLTILMREAFGQQAAYWWSWYCDEADFGERVYTDTDGKQTWGAHDADGNPICYSWESLWATMQECQKKQL